MNKPKKEPVTVAVTFIVEAEATLVWEEYAPGVGEYFVDDVDADDLYHAILKKLNEGDFDYEVDE